MRRLYERVHSPSALLAFEAAARHLSFTRAAAELNVSQPAISTAVRKVETALGVPLFIRRNRAIALTDAGERFYADVSFGLNHILESADSLHVQGQPDHVTIACSMAFANYWLVPRLAAFRADHPDIELRMQTSHRDSDLVREGVSLGIRRGNGDWQGYSAQFLFGERISPVCSPTFLDQHGAINSVAQLPRHELIHLEEPFRFRPTWSDYFGSHGVPFKDTGAGLRLNEYALVIQAAIAGQGIAFGWHHLTDPLVNQNLLVRPVPDSYSQVKGFYLVWSESGSLHPKAHRVAEWLLSQEN